MDIHISKGWLFSISVIVAVAIFVGYVLFYFWHFRRKGKYSPFNEYPLRLPGHTVGLRHSQKSDELVMRYIQFILTSVAIPFIVLFLNGSLRIVLSFLMLLCVVYILHKTWQLFVSLRSYRLGRQGEEYTGQELNLLMRSGAFVFHDIPYKYGNIDHLVVGKNKIFVVETKAVSKRQSKNSNSKESKVISDGKYLKFPHFTTTEPITQAQRHAKFLLEILKKECDLNIPVVAVVALPGWFVKADRNHSDVLVINPKRGRALKEYIGELDDKESRDKAVNYLASVARSVDYSSDKTDPDASKKYDFWLNPRVKETLLGD